MQATRRQFLKATGAAALAVSLASVSPFEGGLRPRGAQAAGQGGAAGERVFRTVCSPNCSSRCSLLVHVQDGKMTKLRPGDLPGRPDYANICARGLSWSHRVYSPDRIKYPMKRVGARGEGKFERISWDEALDLAAQKLEETREKYGARSAAFFRMTGNLSQFALDSVTRFCKCFEGTNFSMEAIMSDHGASMGMRLVYGQTRGSHDHRDYVNSKMLILWGRNVADTHTNEMRYILDAKQKGTKLVVIDPRQCSSAAVADVWLPIRPGTDTALALGMMNVIIGKGLHDEGWLVAHSCAPLLVREDDGRYLRERDVRGGQSDAYMVWDPASSRPVPQGSQGVRPALSGSVQAGGIACRTAFDHLLDEVKQYTPSRAAEITGLPEATIVDLSVEYAMSRPSAIRMGQGMQRVYNSHLPFRTVATLAAICGYVGVSGGGASHLGGISPVRPLPGASGSLFTDRAWSDTGGHRAVDQPGITMYDMISSEEPYPVKFLWLAGSNFINQSPDANRLIDEVLPKLDFVVTADPVHTWTARYSDLILPVTTFFERWDMVQKTPWILLQQPVVEPLFESRSDIEIFTDLARRLGLEEYWSRSDEEWVRSYLTSSNHPAMEGFSWDEFVETGIFTRKDALFDPIFAFGDHSFRTPTGKFEFYTETLKPFDQEVPTYTPSLEDPRGPLGQKYPLVFVQYHHRFGVHSQHRESPWLKEIDPQPAIEINRLDAEARGIRDGDLVEMKNDRGHCVTRAFVTDGIRPGVVAMAQGWAPEDFVEGHYQELTHLTISPAEMAVSESNFAAYDCLVDVQKV